MTNSQMKVIYLGQEVSIRCGAYYPEKRGVIVDVKEIHNKVLGTWTEVVIIDEDKQLHYTRPHQLLQDGVDKRIGIYLK